MGRKAVHELTRTWVGATAKQIARAVRRGDTSATQVVAEATVMMAEELGLQAIFRP